MCELFLSITRSNIENYAGDTSLYKCETNLIEVDTKIKIESLKVFKWFWKNYLKEDDTKSHFILRLIL